GRPLTGRPLLFHSNEFQIRFTRKKSIIFSFSVWNSENKQTKKETNLVIGIFSKTYLSMG
ncbi:MAG: hypothetical protein LIO47_06615, partial [Akkermansia sp.]|nr:hypothetical protein [Akkermansia sp.]